MNKTITVFRLPCDAEKRADEIVGACAVAIDVLRSTTTLTYACKAGVSKIVPVLCAEDALKFKAGSAEDIILGGEQGCNRIPQFDVGNSPSDMIPELVKNKTLVFKSTNGTLAMFAAKRAKKLLLGCLANVGALARELLLEDRVVLICSGTEGQVTSEDILLAGMIVSKLKSEDELFILDETAESCLDFWNQESKERDLYESLLRSGGAKNLLQLGYDNDIEFAARCNTTDAVPQIEFDKIDYSILGESVANYDIH
ncbi:MAG: 2-phosphosulfolactate phosphatase [Planctomycetaceae bacterium]|jgi:2-phosphosulfolactate phosphatase|nr:2-phosphosulfolactate phosphatase [Planctomycetaceae bacterium]